MSDSIVICHSFVPDGQLNAWRSAFPNIAFHDARSSDAFAACCAEATIAYGLPQLNAIGAMPSLRWIQLATAGVPVALCPMALQRGVRVTNLSGLYGPTIAEHTLAMMFMLFRNLHAAQRQQQARIWDLGVAKTMRDLAGGTLGIIGLGDIGTNIARLGQAMGMRVVGCRRTPKPTPFVDRVYEFKERNSLAAESDAIAVAVPLTRATEGLLDREFFQSVRPGSILVNVSRGPVVDEAALCDALDSGRLRGAGLDVFAVEPLPAESPLWTHPGVIVTPHCSGDVVNDSSRPAERFTRNLRHWLAGRDLEGNVSLEAGY